MSIFGVDIDVPYFRNSRAELCGRPETLKDGIGAAALDRSPRAVSGYHVKVHLTSNPSLFAVDVEAMAGSTS